MGLDKLQENAVVRIIDDDDSMRKSWRFLIEGEGWATKCYSSALRFLEARRGDAGRGDAGHERDRTAAGDDAAKEWPPHHFCVWAR